jgi:hypothetical protein
LNAIVVTWRELLVALVVVLAIYAAEMWLLTRGLRAARVADAPPQPPAEPAATPPDPFAAVALRSEIDTLRGEVAQLRAELDAVTAPATPTGELAPYAQAIRLARDGKAAAQLAETCGISRSEADLIVALHQRG